MPQSPFGTPLTVTHKETQFLPFTSHGANGEEICGGIAEQGTQMDALGHFAHRPLGGEDVFYYNGFTQEEVVGPDGLQRLGIEKYKPIITTFTLLDAVAHNGGVPLEAGEQVTTDDIKAMLRRQHLPALQPGDVLFIYTGWSQKWQDENPNPLFTEYYSKGPGLSPDAALYLEDKVIALVGLDNPFTDAVPDGFLQNGFPPPAGTPPDLPFFIHHHNLTQAGIAQIQNVKLDELIADQVYRGAIFIFPLQIAGGAGSPVTPVAVGGPWFF
jgi:kynurenine formamidase